MLRLRDVSLMRGTRVLYSHANLITSPGERIGLVGPNGCGKSTLFAAILQDLSCEDGDIDVPPLERIASVAQEIKAVATPALDWVIEGHAPLMAAKAALAAAQAGTDDMELARAHATLAELNEGAISAQAGAILHGLGFLPSDLARPMQDFSGGWRNRLALARALMRPADLLLLDEPTNHLDMDSVIWLENWLRRQEATTVIISHDREFLDRSTQVTWSIEDGTIRRYAGNYSAYEQMRVEMLRQQEASARAYDTAAAHLKAYIERFRYKATKARQAQSRIKMLEKLEAVEHVKSRREWRFEFPEPEKLPDHLIDAEGLALGYGDKRILSGVKFYIRSGERIGILGVNGAGKSTLVKGMCGEIAPMAGEIRRGTGLVIGYFAQHQLDQLRTDETPLQHMRRKAPLAREQELRDFLGNYRFNGDMCDRKTGPMSGGEKARLALALIAWDKPNLLILDEPTNHLDMETREALTVALSSYPGAMILVSHDRHLLRATSDKLWLVHDGAVGEFDGDLDDYAKLVLEVRKEAVAADAPMKAASAEPQVNRREQRKAEAAERQRIATLRRPLQKKLEKVEAEMAKANETLKSLDEKLADADFYNGNLDEVASTLKERGETASRVEELEGEWLELSESIEAIQ